MNIIVDVIERVSSVVVAILRLMLLTCVVFVSGLHTILFSEIEICKVDMRGMPLRYRLRRDEANLAFLDKMAIENPELIEYAEDEANFPSDDEQGDQ